jgi:hypothetical protein
MAKVKLTPGEWGDFVMVFLLDAIVHPDILDENPEFREMVDEFKTKGVKSNLLKYYLSLPGDLRIKYKRLKPTMIAEKGEDQADILIRRPATTTLKKAMKKVEKGKKKSILRKAVKAVTGVG